MRIGKVKFKTILKLYALISIAVVAITAIFIGCVFKNEISLAYRTERLLENFSRGKADISEEDLQERITKYPGITNIVVIGANNEIIIKANEYLLPDGTLTFTQINNGVWQIEGVTNAMFDTLGSSTIGRWVQATLNINSVNRWMNKSQSKDGFYVFDNTKYYDCVIAVNPQGEKLLFVFDWQPLENGGLVMLLGVIVLVLVIMAGWLLIALWVYKDASQRRCAGIVWGLLALFTNILGLFIYLIYRNWHKTCHKCSALQDRNDIYCTFCGNKMEDTCSRCQGILREKDLYCPHCGLLVEEH